MLAVPKRRHPVADQGLDCRRRHALWNPILAEVRSNYMRLKDLNRLVRRGYVEAIMRIPY